MSFSINYIQCIVKIYEHVSIQSTRSDVGELRVIPSSPWTSKHAMRQCDPHMLWPWLIRKALYYF